MKEYPFALRSLRNPKFNPIALRMAKTHSFDNSECNRGKSMRLRGGWVVQRCWVNFQCRGVLLTLIIVGQGPIVLAVGAGGGCLDIFSFIYHFSFLSPSLWETARYRLKYCLKGP